MEFAQEKISYQTISYKRKIFFWCNKLLIAVLRLFILSFLSPSFLLFFKFIKKKKKVQLSCKQLTFYFKISNFK
ncbi:hypothetical protein BpHYR1_036520 [Brachionus plicatilis]|uniref:Uncharacterized protein n=1 Tax=Brachionus plicatilis TaxID=10195 RepID=A0A3M7SCE0_BRAPC|nr:hypothetical protein BpHYR1_036520 [Brachionus plicatilis]